MSDDSHPTPDHNFFSDKISDKEQSRFDRQLRLPGWNQHALKDSCVLILGVGGLGVEIAKNLAMAGVGTIHLVDMDHIEYSNLNRQILFIDAKEGESKAVAAAKMLQRINPFSTYIPHHKPLQELDPQIYETADLYIAGLDTIVARAELNRRAVMYEKMLVDGGTATYHGHVYSYIPSINSCLACDPMREREQDDLAACTLVGVPRKKSHCLLKGQLAYQAEHEKLPSIVSQEEVEYVVNYANNLVTEHFPDESLFTLDDAVKAIDHHEPAIITINAVIASLQSQDALRLLHHLKGTKLGDLPTKYTIYNGLFSNFFQFDKPQNPKCEVCGPNAPKKVQIRVKATTTFQTILMLLKKQNFTWDPDFDPLIFRMDRLELEEVEQEETLQDIEAKNKEIFVVSGVEQENYDNDTIYLEINLV